MIKGIIFDIGDVLLNFDTDFYSNASEILDVPKNKLKKVVDKEWNRLQRGEETSVVYWKRVCSKLNITCPKDEILKALWTKPFISGLKINDSVVDIVIRLAVNYPLVIISNTEQDNVGYITRQTFVKYFDVILLSPEVGMRKPEREIFELAANKLSLSLGELLFIDDKQQWVRAAENIGIKSIQFHSSIQLEEDLHKLKIKL